MSESVGEYAKNMIRRASELRPPEQPVWPTEDEKSDYTEWVWAVGNGDTALGFRAWMNNGKS